MYVKCPECHKRWLVQPGTPDIVCDCHKYCSQGDKPADCSVTTVKWEGELGWPRGLHRSEAEHDSDRPCHTYYCSVHDEYYDKVPVLIDVDWLVKDRRAPKDMRDFGEGTF